MQTSPPAFQISPTAGSAWSAASPSTPPSPARSRPSAAVRPARSPERVVNGLPDDNAFKGRYTSDDVLNIVVLGSSYAALSFVHPFLSTTIPTKLRTVMNAPKYRVIMLSPSTHAFWNIAAPRALVAPDAIKPPPKPSSFETSWARVSRRAASASASIVRMAQRWAGATRQEDEDDGHGRSARPAGFSSWDDDDFVSSSGLDRLFWDVRTEIDQQYGLEGDNFEFVQGEAVSINFQTRQIYAKLVSNRATGNPAIDKRQYSFPVSRGADGVSEVCHIPYHGLIIATGSSSDSPLLSLHGPHEGTFAAIANFHAQLQTAKRVVIVGGGPSGCEIAGQISIYFRQRGSKQNSEFGKSVTIVSGHTRLLPLLPEQCGKDAQSQLESLGVTVIHKLRVTRASEPSEGKEYDVTLQDGTVLRADSLIAATGVKPNSNFMPEYMVDRKSRAILVDPITLAVQGAGPRVYSFGDCASYSHMNTTDVYEASPVVQHNMASELIEFEIRNQFPSLGADNYIRHIGADVKAGYVDTDKRSLLMPLTRWGGVGLLYDVRIPSWLVWALKGRDYRVTVARKMLDRGKSPYGPQAFLVR